MSRESEPKGRCQPKKGAPTKAPFPVFPGEPAIDGSLKRSKMGRRRAIVLGAVHLAIILHIVHWLTRGTTVSPVEPSEAMRTLEFGEVNAGFLFFAVALLSTAILGRFFCGWGCHVVALQDLCGYLMKKIGVRPRPFRSRLLVFAPLAFAVYMFVWPTFKREVLMRLIGDDPPAYLAWIQPPVPFPGFSNHLQTNEFWATFPGWAVAIPFFLICGFATVYFLGAKGFCTYGCPYGGFFGLVDGFAPGRIRVNDDCEQCGHCTAVCTSNVRVHEEVRHFKMVVDPGCMKCLDCVSTCPKDALSFGFGNSVKSAVHAASSVPKKRYDLSLREEAFVALAFLATFVASRSVYGVIPLLMAIGIAACAAFLFWKTYRLVIDSRVAIQRQVLKRDGRITSIGVTFSGLAIVVGALAAHSGFIKWSTWRAEHWDRKVAVPSALAFQEGRPSFAAAIRSDAERAETHYRRADEFRFGGVGLLPSPEIPVRRAWLAVVLDRFEEAARHLRRITTDARAPTHIHVQLARVLSLGQNHGEAADILRARIALEPAAAALHGELAQVFERAGDTASAITEWIILVNLAPDDVGARDRLIALLEQVGRHDEAERYRRMGNP